MLNYREEIYGEILEELCSCLENNMEISRRQMKDLKECMIAEAANSRGIKAIEARIQNLYYYDTLTGLPNRELFIQVLNERLVQCRQKGQKGILLLVDINSFKMINDIFGHYYGDELLRETAKKLRYIVGDEDVLARVGPDEFILLKHGIEHIEEARTMASELLEQLKGPLQIEEQSIDVTVNIGVTMYPEDSNSIEGLLKNADVALATAKNNGKDRLQFYESEMENQVFNKAKLEKELQRALEKEEFILFYQPIINSETGEVVSMEALIRWAHPEKGYISPMEFIPLAEETGLIVPIGQWVLREACLQNKRWQEQEKFSGRVSVNVSTPQIQQNDFIYKIKQILKETGLRPHDLTIEITENILMDSFDSMIDVLNYLRKIGITISLDDFGTGYSSLSYLNKLPIDIIKIDKCFVDEIGLKTEDELIVGTIIELAHKMNLHVTAEGVETEEQQVYLIDKGCNHLQGYFISKPGLAHEIEDRLQRDYWKPYQANEQMKFD